MNNFTANELALTRTAIAADQAYGHEDEIDLDDYRLVRTHETTDNFKNSPTCRFAGLQRAVESGEGWTIDAIS